MTHHEHPNVLEQVLELLAENGFDGMADALQAQPYERTGRRRGYANGFKSKVLQTRIGTIPLAIPHNRWLQQTVQKYHTSAPKLAEWLEANVPESLTVLRWPPAHRRRLRTTNMLERLNEEIKRRTRVATLFPNEASLLRLVSAVLAEITEEWETGKVYLNMETK